MRHAITKDLAALLAAGAVFGLTAHGQTIIPPPETPVTVQGDLIIEPEDTVTVDTVVTVDPALQVPTLEDTGDPNTFYVVQLVGDAGETTTETTAGGVELTTQGNVTLSGEEQTATTISYLRAVRIELENETLIPQGPPVPVGGYLDGAGNFIEVGEMTGDDGSGNAIFSAAYFAAMDPADLAAITQDPVVTELGGGNLQVGGDANVDGKLTAGSLEVDGDAWVHGQIDVDTLRVYGEAVMEGDAFVSGGLDVGGEIAGGSLDIHGDASIGNELTVDGDTRIKGTLTVGPDSIVINPATHHIHTSAGQDLTIGNGEDITINGEVTFTGDVDMASNLAVANNANIGNDLFVGNNANIGNDLDVGGDAHVRGYATIDQGLYVGAPPVIVQDPPVFVPA
jgi:predicted acyltransferase (DUF342 family)